MSQNRDSPVIEIDNRHFFIWFFIIFHCVAYYGLRGYWEGYYNISNMLMELINSKIDLSFIFWITIGIPFFCYIIYVIVSIWKFFWTSYSFLNIRVFTANMKLWFEVFGVTTIGLSLIFNISFIYIPLIIGIMLPILLHFTLFQRKYDEIRELEAEKEGEDEFAIHTTLSQILIVLILIGILITFVAGWFLENAGATTGTPVHDFLLPLWNQIYGDIPLLITFGLWVFITFVWPILYFIYVIVYNILFNRIENIKTWFKVLYFAMIVYLLVKIALFIVSEYAPEPYPTMISLSGSIFSGLLTHNAKKISDWGGALKNKFNLRSP
jgi:hypothetical protein